MTNTYTIFFTASDVYNFVTLECEADKLVETLVNEELLETAEEFKLVNWLILENGKPMS